MVRIPSFHCCGLDLIPGGGTCKSTQCGQKIKIKENVLEEKKKNMCNGVTNHEDLEVQDKLLYEKSQLLSKVVLCFIV